MRCVVVIFVGRVAPPRCSVPLPHRGVRFLCPTAVFGSFATYASRVRCACRVGSPGGCTRTRRRMEGWDRTSHTVSVVTMSHHVQGMLSVQAIQAFRRIRSVELLLLSPCCLPNKSLADAPHHLYVLCFSFLQISRSHNILSRSHNLLLYT